MDKYTKFAHAIAILVSAVVSAVAASKGLMDPLDAAASGVILNGMVSAVGSGALKGGV